MKTSHLKIQVGSVLYEASKSLRTVIQWIVCEFYIDYMTCEVIVRVFSKYTGMVEKSPEVVCKWQNSEAEARECLEEMLL